MSLANDFLYAIVMFAFFIFIMPLMLTFLHPSVAESVDPSLGECNVYYDDVYYPCKTWAEAYMININFGVIVSVVYFFYFVGSHIYLTKKKKERKSIEDIEF